jgi:hypothetical protein
MSSELPKNGTFTCVKAELMTLRASSIIISFPSPVSSWLRMSLYVGNCSQDDKGWYDGSLTGGIVSLNQLPELYHTSKVTQDVHHHGNVFVVGHRTASLDHLCIARPRGDVAYWLKETACIVCLAIGRCCAGLIVGGG